jgi:hypothetical protein
MRIIHALSLGLLMACKAPGDNAPAVVKQPPSGKDSFLPTRWDWWAVQSQGVFASALAAHGKRDRVRRRLRDLSAHLQPRAKPDRTALGRPQARAAQHGARDRRNDTVGVAPLARSSASAPHRRLVPGRARGGSAKVIFALADPPRSRPESCGKTKCRILPVG